MVPKVVRIATRKSALALWQANHVAQWLRDNHPGIRVELLPMSTRGDEILDKPLAKIGGKGLFLKELERALLDEEADIAVHSMKDVPMEMTPGLEIVAVSERADPRDAWVSRSGQSLNELPAGAIVGTSSLRRQCQILSRRPDLVVNSLRGNVHTRLMKMDAGRYDAIILAAAGLERLELADRITSRMTTADWIPAPAQGAIGVQARSNDQATRELLNDLNHHESRQAVKAERALSRALGGSCQLPLAAFARCRQDNSLELNALVGQSDGEKVVRARAVGPVELPSVVANEATLSLMAQGADTIIRAEIEGKDH